MLAGDQLPTSGDEIERSDSAVGNESANAEERAPRVVVPLDGSELSERALSVGQSLAEILGGTIELLHVVDSDDTSSDAKPRYQVEGYLDNIARRLPDTIPVSSRILTGNPIEQLLNALHHATRTIVAMSTHGRSGLQRFFFGSVADQVIRGVNIPVAVVRDTTHFTPSIRNLLVPLDGSEHAATALPLAMLLAGRERGLGIVRVLDPSHRHEDLTLKYGSIWTDDDLLNEITIDAQREARASQEEIATRLRAAGYRTFWEVRAGHPSDEIIRAAETTGTDLIIMATHGLGGVRRLAFGSVTDEVIHRSHVPVLVIPPHCDWAGGRPATLPPDLPTDR